MVLKIMGLIIACGFMGWCMYSLAKTDDAVKWGEIDYKRGTWLKFANFAGIALAVCFIALLGC